MIGKKLLISFFLLSDIVSNLTICIKDQDYFYLKSMGNFRGQMIQLLQFAKAKDKEAYYRGEAQGE